MPEPAKSQEAVGVQGTAMNAGYAAAAERIEAETGLPRGVVLDIGCNTGDGMRVLAARWPEAELIGLEPVLRFALIARRHGCRVEQAIAERIPLEDASVDVVFSRHSLEHVQRRAVALAEIARVLKPGGLVYIQAPLEPGGTENLLHISPFETADELRSLFPGWPEIYWGPQPTVAELIVQKPQSRNAGRDGALHSFHPSPPASAGPGAEPCN